MFCDCRKIISAVATVRATKLMNTNGLVFECKSGFSQAFCRPSQCHILSRALGSFHLFQTHFILSNQLHWRHHTHITFRLIFKRWNNQKVDSTPNRDLGPFHYGALCVRDLCKWHKSQHDEQRMSDNVGCISFFEWLPSKSIYGMDFIDALIVWLKSNSSACNRNFEMLSIYDYS